MPVKEIFNIGVCLSPVLWVFYYILAFSFWSDVRSCLLQTLHAAVAFCGIANKKHPHLASVFLDGFSQSLSRFFNMFFRFQSYFYPKAPKKSIIYY